MNPIYPQRRDDLIVDESDNELIMLDGEAEAIHVLNPTAKHVWDLCDSQHTAEDIEQLLRKRFSVPPERDVLTDVIETLNTFQNNGLLQIPG